MTWTPIAPGDIDADSPITTTLIAALRDNVAAAFNKDSGAPQLANDYITDAMISSPATGSTVVKRVKGTSDISSTSGTYPTWDADYEATGLIVVGTALVSGVIKVQWEMKAASGGTVWAKVMVNGVTQGSPQSTTFTTYSAYSQDATVSAGDLIQFSIRLGGGAAWYCRSIDALADSAKLCIS